MMEAASACALACRAFGEGVVRPGPPLEDDIRPPSPLRWCLYYAGTSLLWNVLWNLPPQLGPHEETVAEGSDESVVELAGPPGLRRVAACATVSSQERCFT